MLLSLILPLAYNNGLPYVREQGLDILIDSGAGRSYLATAVLDHDGPLATRARAVGAENSCEAAGLAFPGASGGILGFDALGAGPSFELTLNELRLDETASPASSVVLTAKALGTATAPYPVMTRVEISVDVISMAWRVKVSREDFHAGHDVRVLRRARVRSRRVGGHGIARDDRERGPRDCGGSVRHRGCGRRKGHDDDGPRRRGDVATAVPGGRHTRGRVGAAAVADGARGRPAAVGGARRGVGAGLRPRT